MMTPTMPTQRLSIVQTFASLREKRRIALMPFIPAGYPDLETTALVLPALEAGGANLIEVGFPFSDPIADGPVIQEAFTKALTRKLRLADIFATIAAVRPRISVPLLAMVSYSIVFRYGVQRFAADSKRAGFDGVIIPDLPPPDAQAACDTIRQAGLDTVLLVAPTTTPQRRQAIAELSSGFVYYLSVSGTTGERDQLPPDLRGNIQALKAMTSRPVCVGFGIYKPEHVAQLQHLADGAIVGSAVVRRMAENEAAGPRAIAASVESYCRDLVSLVR
jgi:tryptophan synthase alpha chain